MSEFFKNRFENYTEEPNPELWKSIAAGASHANKVRKIRRVSVISAVSLAVIAGAVVLTDRLSQEDAIQPENAVAAVQTTGETTISDTPVVSAEEEVSNVPASAQTAAKAARQENKTAVAPQKTAEPVANTAEENKAAAAKQSAEPKNVTTFENTNAVPVKNNIQQNNPKSAIAENATPKVGASSSSSSDDNSSSTSESTEILIPNAFLPDAGGENSRFCVKPVNADNIKDYEMRIFSRGGAMVFHTKTLTDAWDGTYKGSKVQAGAYAYMMNYTDNNGKKHVERGTVTVIR